MASPALQSSPSLSEMFARPGIAMRPALGQVPLKESDMELLESKLEVKIGENLVKKIEFSADGQAFVELENEADIDKVLSSEIKLAKSKPPLLMEHFDLTEVWQPYLVVSGLEDWIEKHVIEEHFRDISKGAVIEFVEIEGTKAKIFFLNSQVALDFPDTTDILGFTLTVEVAYSSPTEEKQMAMAVKGLPLGKIPESNLRGALVSHFSKHTGFKATECRIVKGVGYMTFEDPTALKAILSNPPSANFFGKTPLEVSAAPISQMLVTDGDGTEETSAAFVRTYSSASESSVFSPTSSMDAKQLKKAYDRESINSISRLESHSSGPDPEASWGYDQRRSRNSSTSLDGGPAPSSGMPQKEIPLFTVPEHAESPLPGGRHNDDMQIQDLEGPCDPSFSTDSPSKVCIEDVPLSKRDTSLIKYYLSSLTSLDCDVKQYGKSFLATFQQPIDFYKLKEAGRSKPLDGYRLSFYLLDHTRKLCVTFGSSHGEPIPSNYMLRLHFEYFAGRGSVEKVDLASPNKAYVTFKHPGSIQTVLSNSECSQLGNLSISLEECYDFMAESGNSVDEEDLGIQPLQSVTVPQPVPAPKYDWSPVSTSLNVTKSMWVEGNLPELNDALVLLNAHASVQQDPSGTPLLKVEPVVGSEGMSDWDDRTRDAVDSFLSRFKEVTENLPKYGRAELIKRAESCGNLTVQVDGDLLTLAGGRDTVDEVMCSIHAMMAKLKEVVSEEKYFSALQMKYLKKFSERRLNNISPPVVRYNLALDLGLVSVNGIKEARTAFWEAIDDEISNVQKKGVSLEPDMLILLKSRRGADAIETAIEYKMADIVYDLVETPDGHTLSILSPPRISKDRLKNIKGTLKKLLESQEVQLDPSKFRFCSDKKWKTMVDRIQTDMFVGITVCDSTQSVIVTGEKMVVQGTISKLKDFLSEQTSVEEQLNIDVHNWSVMNKGLGLDRGSMQSTKDVKIEWPQKEADGFCAKVNIVIRGDPTSVDKVKGELEALAKKVCHREEKMRNIAAAMQVVSSMDDKIRVLETNYGASIDVSLTSDDMEPGLVHSQSATALSESKLCSATTPNEVRISVYKGDFTKHNHVDVIVVFLPPDLSRQNDNNLQLLFAAGGVELQNDFHVKISQLVMQSSGDLFSSKQGKLQCSKLWYCFIPPWSGGAKNEEFYLRECLGKVLSTKGYNTILFASVCSTPLKYPVDVFAKNVIDSIASNPYISGDLMVAVYVSEDMHGREFEKQFNSNNCRVSATFVPVAKTISSSISSFITLMEGNLLDVQADVYVNSTNANLDLKTGTLSKMMLEKCGEELQKECSEWAPLKSETVAVTEAKNLKAKSIYHIALLDYQPNHHSAMKKFKGTVKAILSTARMTGATSLAIPSLGVGNLHFPAQISAKILFEEVIEFQSRNPGFGMKCHFVIYDQKIYQEFSKEYAQKMSSAVPQRKVLGKSSKTSAGVTRLSVEKSDISEEETDVIVNTTSEEMQLSTSAVSKALLDKAGQILQQSCDQLVQSGFRLDHGDVVDTKAFGSLKCKKIIHAHVPLRSDAVKAGVDHASLIAETVAKCLKKAETLGMTSISFPAFGFGQGGYSVDEVAGPMLTAFREFGREGPKQVQTIKVVIFDQKLHKQYFDFFVDFFKVDTSAPQKIVSTIKSKLNPKGGHGGKYVELQDGAQIASIRQSATHHEPVNNQVLLFNIYAPSADKCSHIATKLKEFVKQKCAVEEIENPVLAYLIDSDIADIKCIGTKLQVRINVIPQIKKIEISGETSDTKEAKIEILKIINEIEKAQIELKSFQWQTESGDDVEQYSEEDSLKLERAQAKKVQALQLVIDQIEVIIDLDKMEERSKDTGVVRKVVRVHSKPPLVLPSTWEVQPVDASGKASTVHMVDVLQGSTEYQETLQNFHATNNQTLIVTSLKRVQNPTLYQKHTTLQDTICKKYSKKVDVRHLFHGSDVDSIRFIATQGFNRMLASDANAAMYGMGVYFALNSSYSSQTKYAKPDKEGLQSMFICRVIIGEYTLGTRGMKKAPLLRLDSTEQFDTLVENKDNPTIFVTMTDAQAYPEYLVTFKVEKKKT